MGQRPQAAAKTDASAQDAQDDTPQEGSPQDGDLPGAAADDPSQDAPQSVTDQACYAIGLQIGRNLKRDSADLSIDLIVKGLLDAYKGKKPLLTEAQCGKAIEAFSREMEGKAAERAKVVGEKNKKEGAAFLAANTKKEGIITLKSGLQYKVLKSGKGPRPTESDSVRTHYHGTLIDGTVFDSSIQRGEPITFGVGEVIDGWTEALLKMKVGDKWQLFVPSALAYRDRGRPPVIGPHAVLVFEIELLGIEKPDQP